MNNNDYLKINEIHCGDAQELLKRIEPESIAVSIWSPPYHVGKKYEKDQSYEEWLALLNKVISLHYPILKPGGFLAINIDDILVFQDPKMPRIMADNVSNKRVSVTREDVIEAMRENPDFNRRQLAKLLGCSEQTVQRRLEGNNVRGGKYNVQTRVKIVGGLIEEMGMAAGLYLYDRRIWVKDPAWANCNWTSNSYRSVSETEYVYIFWKPGITKIDRGRLEASEWAEWGSRGVWYISSVAKNDDHEAKFPLALPERLIRLFSETNDIVLDCFMGSGTTAIAAINTSRNYIGIELDERYVSLAKDNIRMQTAQMSFFE